MKYWHLLSLTGLAALSLGACNKEDDTPPFDPEPIIQAYLADNNLTDAQRTESGLYYVIEELGGGVHPTVDSFVAVNYTGRLTNGEVFDQSRSGPSRFPRLGGLILGWQEGLPLIGRGGKIKLIVPPALGYGTQANGPIPANSVLIFDVELVGFTPNSREIIDAYLGAEGIDSAQTTASGLTYIIHEPGGDERPAPSDQVRVEYVGTYLDGQQFDSSNGAVASFRLDGLIQAWREGIPLIGEGGRITLITPYQLAYGARGQGKIPPYAVLRFEIELISFNGQ